MKKRFMGKYASGNRKAAEQLKAEKDFIKSLPLAIRKAMKARDAACAAFNAAVGDNLDRSIIIQRSAEYHALVNQVNEMIGALNGLSDGQRS